MAGIRCRLEKLDFLVMDEDMAALSLEQRAEWAKRLEGQTGHRVAVRLLSVANVQLILGVQREDAPQWVSDAAYGLHVGSVHTTRLVLAAPDSPLLRLPTPANIPSLPDTQLEEMVQRFDL